MANSKSGFQYYAVETNRYEDIRIKRLKKDFSTDGIAIYDKVLNEIYRVKGYFIVWDQSVAFDVADYFDKPESLVEQVIKHCCELGLFNEKLFESKGLLTSAAIQRRFIDWSKRAKRSNVKIISAFKLQEESDILPEESLNLPEESPKIQAVCPEVTKPNQTKPNQPQPKEKVGDMVDHEYFKMIFEDQIFFEAACIQNKIDEKKFTAGAVEFFRIKIGLGTKWKDYSDCKKNFMYWIPSWLNRRQETFASAVANGTATYVAPQVKEVIAEDPQELKRKNEAARESMLKMIEEDVEKYSINENTVLKIPVMKYNLLLKEKIITITAQQKKNYLDDARDQYLQSHRNSFEIISSRSKLHSIERTGKFTEEDESMILTIAKELAYKDYLKFINKSL